MMLPAVKTDEWRRDEDNCWAKKGLRVEWLDDSLCLTTLLGKTSECCEGSLPLDMLRIVLAEHGLHIVSESSKTTLDRFNARLLPEELEHEAANRTWRVVGAMDIAVLEGMGGIPATLLQSWVESSQVTRGLPQLALDELARRRAKKEKPSNDQ
jgi:hypothetical protein